MNRSSMTAINLTAAVLLLGLAACGGGGGGGGSEPAAQEQAVIDIALTGGSSTIGSVYLELELPEGFTLETDARGNLAAGVLGTDLPDAHIEAVYLPENNVNHGLLRLGLIRAGGFSPKKFCTLSTNLDTGEVLPLKEEFAAATLTVTDLNGRELPGYAVAVSVQKQEIPR